MKDPGSRNAVRDGSRVLRFDGELIADESSQRPGAVRWSQISLYRLEHDGYVVEKVGYSAVAHDPGCLKVRSDMPTLADARDEDREIRRVPCLDCQPDLHDAQLRLERTRHRAFVVPDAEGMIALLVGDRGDVPALITRVLDAAAAQDRQVMQVWRPSRTG